MTSDNRGPIPETFLLVVARAMAQIMGDIHELAAGEEGESLSERLRDHLGVDPHSLPVTSHDFALYQLVDIQVASRPGLYRAPLVTWALSALPASTEDSTLSLLLETRILLWWLSDEPRLPGAARGAISSPDNEVIVSAAAYERSP